MKFTNLIIDNCKPKVIISGIVDVTTGYLWFKKTRTVRVFRLYDDHWRFSDTGEITPGYQLNNLEAVYAAMREQK